MAQFIPAGSFVIMSEENVILENKGRGFREHAVQIEREWREEPPLETPSQSSLAYCGHFINHPVKRDRNQ